MAQVLPFITNGCIRLGLRCLIQWFPRVKVYSNIEVSQGHEDKSQLALGHSPSFLLAFLASLTRFQPYPLSHDPHFSLQVYFLCL